MYLINKWFIIINIILYITVYLGLIFQILLGAVQVVMAIIIAFNFSKLIKRIKRLFIIYSIATIVFLVVFFTGYLKSNNDLYELIAWVIIPQTLAFLHLYITFLIHKNIQNETKHS